MPLWLCQTGLVDQKSGTPDEQLFPRASTAPQAHNHIYSWTTETERSGGIQGSHNLKDICPAHSQPFPFQVLALLISTLENLQLRSLVITCPWPAFHTALLFLDTFSISVILSNCPLPNRYRLPSPSLGSIQHVLDITTAQTVTTWTLFLEQRAGEAWYLTHLIPCSELEGKLKM